MADRLRAFFADRPALAIRRIEKEVGIPIKTLEHFVKGRRKLSPGKREMVIQLLQAKYGYQD